jgi:acetolactate synthase-1/2/3 large subunit
LPQYAIRTLYEKCKDQNPVVGVDVGQHQMWVSQLWEFTEPNAWLNSGGLGTMGYCLPAAIGAQFVDKKRLVIAIVGDGGFQMTYQDMGTAAHHGINVKCIIMNNKSLGMVRQWQELFYDEHYSQVDLSQGSADFVLLAEAHGWKASRVSDPKDLSAAYDEMLAHDGPYLMDVRTETYENVYPMVPAGAGINDMVFPKDIELI